MVSRLTKAVANLYLWQYAQAQRTKCFFCFSSLRTFSMFWKISVPKICKFSWTWALFGCCIRSLSWLIYCWIFFFSSSSRSSCLSSIFFHWFSIPSWIDFCFIPICCSPISFLVAEIAKSASCSIFSFLVFAFLIFPSYLEIHCNLSVWFLKISFSLGNTVSNSPLAISSKSDFCSVPLPSWSSVLSEGDFTFLRHW